jgi:hypothetical protein
LIVLIFGVGSTPKNFSGVACSFLSNGKASQGATSMDEKLLRQTLRIK